MTKTCIKTKKIINNIHKNKQQYGLWIFWSFAVIKMIALFAGFFWAIALIGNHTQAAYETFCNDNLWSLDIPVAECEALVNLYNSTDGASWYNNYRWWTSTTICNNSSAGWNGITCNFWSPRHVTRIILNSNNLSWSIPSLSTLTYMQYIWLQNNQLTSIATDAFVWLSSLLQLELNNNLLTNIPNNLFVGLSSLQNLWLGYNQITSIPDNITLLPLVNSNWLTIGNNKLCTWSMNSTFIAFANLKAWTTNWQVLQTPGICPPPRMGTFVINNNAASTTSSTVILDMTASSGTQYMNFSNTGINWPRSSWEVYSPTKAWTLFTGYGIKTVRAQFDSNGDTATVEWTLNDTISYTGTVSTGTVSTCIEVWSWWHDVTLCIEPIGYGYCEYGNSLDLGTTWYSSSSREMISPFSTLSGNTAWFCNDLQGAAPRTLNIQSSDLLNITTNDPAQTVSNTHIYIRNPSATVIQWVCTANHWSSSNQRTSINSSTVILGKSAGSWEVCKVQTSSLDLKVIIPIYQAIGQYSGTLTITIPNL